MRANQRIISLAVTLLATYLIVGESGQFDASGRQSRVGKCGCVRPCARFNASSSDV